ncbi:hypothetical protein SDC9_142226 [bioreactor metagenome]|uniref:Uncharacterized protein n=1 Tax=bioreactor metagenome TaxID=1076179 RepID=A0A645E0J6_9ZZZZ
MPSVYTSENVTLELKAIDARIAIFLPASRPSISAVGSASAYPRSVASLSASSNSIPSSDIFVRIKLVVPLIIPIISVMLFAARHCLRGLIIGIPPATAASKRRSQPCSAAVSRSSCPCSAIKSLFAVTTCLPRLRASEIYVFAGSIPPITSMIISMLSSFIISVHLSVIISDEMPSRALFTFLTRIFEISNSAPIL